MGCVASKPRKPPQTPPRPPQNPASFEPHRYSPREPHIESPRSPLQILPMAEGSTTTKIIVRSKLTLEDVQFSDVTPHSTTRQDFKYNCPICMKYLTSILITNCCGNYLCHFCLAEYQTKEVHFQICCPMCKAEPLILEDVDPSSAVKRYSDSPYSSFSGNRSSQTGAKWISKLAIVQEDEQLAKELAENDQIEADFNERDQAIIGFSSTA